MKIYGAVGTVVNDPIKHKAGINFSIGLGRENGFAKVAWFQKVNFTFELKKGDTILIPVGNMRNNIYVAESGIEYKNIEIQTNYIELYNYATTGKIAKEKLDRAEKVLEESKTIQRQVGEFKDNQLNAIRIDPVLSITPSQDETWIKEQLLKELDNEAPTDHKEEVKEEIEW